MNAEELVQRAEQSSAAAVETIVVPEWDDAQVVVRPVEASTLKRLQADEALAGRNAHALTQVDAEWLTAGIVDPPLSTEQAVRLLRTQAAPTNRLLGIIQVKSQIGQSAEAWALRTLELTSPDLRALAEVYRAARAGNRDLLDVLKEALQQAEAEGTSTTFEGLLAQMQTALAETWTELVAAEKKDSSASPLTDTPSGEPA